jgi:hypothetical protein
MTSSRLAIPALSCLVFLAVNGWADDWPMLGHDAARSGGTASELPSPFTRQWYRLFPDEGIQSGVQPVIAGGKVYLGTLRGIFHAMDAETGKDVWTFQAGGPILHAAAVGAGRVFIGSADGCIQALGATGGDRLWIQRTGAAIWNAPAVYGGIVFIGSRDGLLYALDAATGETRWKADTGAPLLNSPAVDARLSRVYIGSEAMRVHAFALTDGREVWRSAKLPGTSMRGYHPVIAPDGSVLVTVAPVAGYDRFQNLLLEMVREVFGDFASWRHNKDENDKLRAENFRLFEKPETYQAQLDYLRRRLAAEPAYQTYFVLDAATGRQRFITPIVASESMNGPGAPPLVTANGRVIVKYQVLLRSRYEHYSPFMNVGYLDTATGHITPIMDQSRTYGWHDSLLLVHDEQCQLSLAGRLLLNTHQDNINALDLVTLKGEPQPLALNLHEPARGEALAIRWAAWGGQTLAPGNEWLMRGTAVYGGGSVLDVPVAIAGDRFYYVPTHELNSGCALIAYRATPGAPPPRKSPVPPPQLAAGDWDRIQECPWDWDTLATPRLKNLLEALPGKIPGTTAAPMTAEAEKKVEAIPDSALDEFIWDFGLDPMGASVAVPTNEPLVERLENAVRELIARPWRPLILPAGKAPEASYRFFNDPSETIYTLLLARPFLGENVRRRVDAFLAATIEAGLHRTYDPDAGQPREAYDVPVTHLRIADEFVRDDLARLYPLWGWSLTPAGAEYIKRNWAELRPRLQALPAKVNDDCGNSRLAGLMAYCRLAKAAGDPAALAEALPITRQAMRARLRYEFAHPRGGVLMAVPNGRMVVARWRRLTPDVARFLATYARPLAQNLMTTYVDYHRPGWWLAWNVEQLMRNENPYQLPTTPLEIFTARALLLGESAGSLRAFLDLPWCQADEYYIQKIAMILSARP